MHKLQIYIFCIHTIYAHEIVSLSLSRSLSLSLSLSRSLTPSFSLSLSISFPPSLPSLPLFEFLSPLPILAGTPPICALLKNDHLIQRELSLLTSEK